LSYPRRLGRRVSGDGTALNVNFGRREPAAVAVGIGGRSGYVPAAARSGDNERLRFMKWMIPVLMVGFVLLVMAWRAGAGTLSEAEARAHLAKGAVLLDVRTPEEFRERSLPGAINLPLATLGQSITNRLPDKQQVVLLHCRSGARSASAEKALRALGYTNAFNLGSFSQAEKVVRGNAP